jgi:ribosomal protein S18 acetylase RimI-like enzyme
MIQQSLKTLSSLKPLYALAERCRIADGYPVKLYWNLLETRRHDRQALDYLYFRDKRTSSDPIGLLSIYYFQDGIEVTAMVDPEHRHQGIFTRLMDKVFNVLRIYSVKSYMLDCHAKAYGFNTQCIARGGVLHHSEIEMYGATELNFSAKKPIILERAKRDDLGVLIQIHQACFPGPSFASVQERLSTMLSEPHRQTWVGKNSEGKLVGKLHVREDEKAVFLHDLGIIPEFQRQGYATSLIHAWYQQYVVPANKPLVVDVLGDNPAAIKLYESGGFAIMNQYNFWQFKVDTGLHL